MTYKDLFKSKKEKETASQESKQEDSQKKAAPDTGSDKATTASKS